MCHENHLCRQHRISTIRNSSIGLLVPGGTVNPGQSLNQDLVERIVFFRHFDSSHPLPTNRLEQTSAA